MIYEKKIVCWKVFWTWSESVPHSRRSIEIRFLEGWGLTLTDNVLLEDVPGKRSRVFCTWAITFGLRLRNPVTISYQGIHASTLQIIGLVQLF